MILYVVLIMNHNFHGIVMTVTITMFVKITSIQCYYHCSLSPISSIAICHTIAVVIILCITINYQ